MIWLILSEEVTHPLQIPEKFLLLAIWHINSLMVFLEVLLSQDTLAFYTVDPTTRISMREQKVVSMAMRRWQKDESYLMPFEVIYARIAM